MELGIISWIEEENFRKAKELGLSFVELDVNDRAEEFLSHLDQVISFSKAYEMPVEPWAAGEATGSTRTASGRKSWSWNTG